MASQALASYGALCGNEIWNQARLKEYADRGLTPAGFDITCSGCAGLTDILPCGFSDPTVETFDGLLDYTLPELDNAPWYDPSVPESKNFAGLLVTSVTMSSAYSRTVTTNTGDGQTLGRLRKNGRTITVHGFLIGKTCCATQYGLSWLTAALADPCGGSDCGGCNLDFLSCCPNISGEDECITTIDANGNAQIYTRPPGETEFQRGSDFWRRMHGVGVVSGPDVIGCRGRSCGCGCGSLIEVEFVLATSSPYLNSIEQDVIPKTVLAPCTEGPDCGFTWLVGSGPCDSGECEDPAYCLEDPNCPVPALPPTPTIATSLGCGCFPLASKKICTDVPGSDPTNPILLRDWGSSTLNFEVYAGKKDLRNIKIQIWQNPLGKDCDITGCEDFDNKPIPITLDCAALYCSDADQPGFRLDNVGSTIAIALSAFTDTRTVVQAQIKVRYSAVTPDGKLVSAQSGLSEDNINFISGTSFTDSFTADGAVHEFTHTLPLTAALLTQFQAGTLKTLSTGASAEPVLLRNIQVTILVSPVPCIPNFPDCDTCSTLIVNYVPAGGTLRFSGEERKVTVTCNGQTRNALRNISNGKDDGPFAWPDLECSPICACVTYDCAQTADDATFQIGLVNRDV